MLTNPPRYPAMPYAAAHAWEKQAAARGVSAVARSHRGFMRAYEGRQLRQAVARLSPWWKRRREGFLARHIAQAIRGENIWEKTRPGTVIKVTTDLSEASFVAACTSAYGWTSCWPTFTGTTSACRRANWRKKSA